MRFEEAAKLRDAIRNIETSREGNVVVDFDNEGRDYIAWESQGLLTSFSVFAMRGGKMTGRDLFRTKSAASEEESLSIFVMSYYAGKKPPATIYLDFNHAATEAQKQTRVDTLNLLAEFFRKEYDYAPEFVIDPEEKRHAATLALSRQNAAEDIRKRVSERGNIEALVELKNVLRLRKTPERIEGFDIAQLDGRHPVASLISFHNGVPDRRNYRLFNLRTTVGIVDDFASMREAVTRRYSRLIKEEKPLPDLLLIDGGIGQVNAVKGALDELGFYPDIVGLAKRDEELWKPNAGEPVKLPRRSEALKVLQAVRDETHRFATTQNQKLRSRDLAMGGLESVKGVGKKRAAELMKAFGSLEAIAAAKPQDIASGGGISGELAATVKAAAKLALENKKRNAAALKTKTGVRYSPFGKDYRTDGKDSAYAADSAAKLAADAAALYGD
jgi:excinuclease ABC subunit C